MTEASAVIELLLQKRAELGKGIGQIDAALRALGYPLDRAGFTTTRGDSVVMKIEDRERLDAARADMIERRLAVNGGRSAAIENGEGPHPDRRRAPVAHEEGAGQDWRTVAKRKARKAQLELAVKAPAPAGPPAWSAPTVRGTARLSLPRRALDEAIVAYLRREQHRAFVRVTEMAGHLEPTYRKPGRPDISWRESVSKAMVRLANDGSIRQVAGRKGAYTVLRRSPGVEVAASKAKRKPRNRKAHASG